MNDILYFTIALLLGYTLNLILIRFSAKLGAISATGSNTQVRWSSRSKPLMGGIPLYLTFLVAGFAFVLQRNVDGRLVKAPEFFPLLIAGTLGFIIGLADDAYNTRPLLKLFGQIGCGIVLIAFGINIQLFNIPILDYALTMIWVVGIMNSFNMLDNMDAVSGLFATGVFVITLVVLAFMGMYGSLVWYVLLALTGAMVGFLALNWNPSKLYMGDTGSQFLGLVLAYIGIRFFWNLPTENGTLVPVRQIILPLLAFSMTILDTTFVTIARLSRGQNPMVGGKDHTTHHLVYLGLNDRAVALVTGSVTAMSGILVVMGIYLWSPWDYIITLTSVVYLGALFLVFAILYRRGAMNLSKQSGMKATQPASIATPAPSTKTPVSV